MERMVLMGSEDVARAGRNIADAAESFARTVQYLDEILQRNTREMNECVDRFEQLMKGGANNG